jgi:hypothetical protein
MIQQATGSPTKNPGKKRRSLKPVEGGLVLRLEPPEEVGTSGTLSEPEEERVSAERVDEAMIRGTREGEA